MSQPHNASVKRSSPVEAIIQTAPDRWLTLTDPVRIVEAGSAEGVAAAIGEVERLTRDEGYFAAGYLAFEAGAAFGLPMRVAESGSGMPLAWFALFEPVTVSETGTVGEGGSYELGEAVPSLDRPAFDSAFRAIKSYLAAGDTYQVNFTFRMTAPFRGDPKGLFADLVRAQAGRYSAYLCTGSEAICSASPELFFSLDGLDISTRPMKGTAPREMTLAADARRQAELRESAKDLAENVMIVDMMRNDLGRIADVGTVETPELFVVERYPTVWQMTSVVHARTRVSLGEIFAALHPSASVTGAPKFRTLEIIRELEAQPRGVYTGAVGYLRPDGNGHFNVAIRTAIVDAARGHAEFGVGSGIIWDSEPASEYEECLLKGAVLGAPQPEFELLETTVWTASGGFLHLGRHLSRMRDSAEYFGFDYREGALRHASRCSRSNSEALKARRCLRCAWLLPRRQSTRGIPFSSTRPPTARCTIARGCRTSTMRCCGMRGAKRPKRRAPISSSSSKTARSSRRPSRAGCSRAPCGASSATAAA
jgi:para-aminobenzoate synthetase/4-amino-4-deoxychorismate lyase